MRETVAIFGADRCLFGSNFPIEKLWTSYRELVDAHRAAIAHLRAEQRDAVLQRNRRRASTGWALERSTGYGERHMPLEIKILDYGDIELESSFLVLGRDCGRTRRVLTLGFLILGGPWPIVVDTGYRSNQIMETLGMRGLQFHENMIENQLARHGVRMGDVRYVCTPICTSTTPARTTCSR